MTSFIFEEGTQTDASGFVSGDTLYFKTAAPTAVVVTSTAASGLNAATTTLTVGSQSLTFATDALGNADDIVFIAANGDLFIGDTGVDTFTLSGASASAAWGLGGADSIEASGAGGHIVHAGDGADIVRITSGA